MIFKYSVYDKSGKKVKGTIEALDIQEAKTKLNDFIIVSLKPKINLNVEISFFKRKKVSKKKLSHLFNVLGLYLKSAIPVVKALLLTKNQQEDPTLHKFIANVYTYVNEGKSFYTALETQDVIFISPYIKNIIKVGEESGKLDVVLIEISKFLKEEDRVFAKTSQALIYPSFIILVSMFLVSFMLTSIVPKIVGVFQNLNQKLPEATQMVINIGNFLQNNYLTLIVAIIGFIATFSIIYKKSYNFRYFLDVMFLKIPLIKKIIISKELGRFSYLTYVLVNSGVNYIKAIDLSVNTLSNEKIKKVFEKALEDVIKGNKFSTSLSKVGFDFDKSFLQSIALAEETSSIADILKNVSEIYIEENENRISILLSLLEPILILVVGAIIGFIVTALLLPMLNMNILK